MGYGDELMAIGHAERTHAETPGYRVAICDASGRPRWHELWYGHPIIAPPQAVRTGEPVTRIINAPGARPYLRYPFTHATGWRFTQWRASEHRGRLYLTAEEQVRGARWSKQLGHFVLVEPSLARDSNPNKAWRRERWEALIAACPDVSFVQMLHRDSDPLPGVTEISVPTFREACAVVAVADGLVATEGGLHHAAAALRRPAVVIFGGCASVRTTGYDDHLNLADTVDPLTPCGRYVPCAHCVAAMARITVEEVSVAVYQMLRTPRGAHAA